MRTCKKRDRRRPDYCEVPADTRRGNCPACNRPTTDEDRVVRPHADFHQSCWGVVGGGEAEAPEGDNSEWRPLPGYPEYESTIHGSLRCYWLRPHARKRVRIDLPERVIPYRAGRGNSYLAYRLRDESDRLCNVTVRQAALLAFGEYRPKV